MEAFRDFSSRIGEEKVFGEGGDSICEDRTYPVNGYVLMDVLLAVFLFSLGFSTLYGLTEGGFYQSRQAKNLLDGANIAQAMMDRLAAHEWQENLSQKNCIPGETVHGTEGRFQWNIYSEWYDAPHILNVSVEVGWQEKGDYYCYKLESLYEVK